MGMSSKLLVNNSLSKNDSEVHRDPRDSLSSKQMMSWINYLYSSDRPRRMSLCIMPFELMENATLKEDVAFLIARREEQAMEEERNNQYEEAKQSYEQNLSFCENVYGTDHIRTLEMKTKLACVLHRLGEHEEAQSMLESAIAGYSNRFWPEHEHVLNVIVKLAQVLQSQGKHEEAELMYKRALEGHIGTLGPDQPETLAVIDQLVQVLYIQGKHEEAELMYKLALQEHVKTLGLEHPDTLNAIAQLAGFLHDHRRYDDATLLSNLEMSVRKRISWPEHPDNEKEMELLTLVQKKMSLDWKNDSDKKSTGEKHTKRRNRSCKVPGRKRGEEVMNKRRDLRKKKRLDGKDLSTSLHE